MQNKKKEYTNIKIPKKKDMNYFQAVTFFSLKPFGDIDKDGVPNYRDCRPFNSKKHAVSVTDPRYEEIDITELKKEAEEKKKKKKKVEVELTALQQLQKEKKLLKKEIIHREKESPIRKLIKKYKPETIKKIERTPIVKKIEKKVIQPIVRETAIATEHAKRTFPKLVSSYQTKIGLGETKEEAGEELRRRVREGLEIKWPEKKEKEPYFVITTKPQQSFRRREPDFIGWPSSTPSLPQAPAIQEEMIPPSSYEEEEPISEEQIAEQYQLQPEQQPEEIQPTFQPRASSPPMSRGWAGSMGGWKPYRPMPYRPTGQIIFRERRTHSPTPRVPFAKIPMFKFPIAQSNHIVKKYVEEEE